MSGGRPPKPALTDEEFNIAIDILAAGDAKSRVVTGAAGRTRPRGMGLRAAVAAINRHRGVDKLLDYDAQRRRRVSVRWLADQLAARRERGKTLSVGKPPAASESTTSVPEPTKA